MEQPRSPKKAKLGRPTKAASNAKHLPAGTYRPLFPGGLNVLNAPIAVPEKELVRPLKRPSEKNKEYNQRPFQLANLDKFPFISLDASKNLVYCNCCSISAGAMQTLSNRTCTFKDHKESEKHQRAFSLHGFELFQPAAPLHQPGETMQQATVPVLMRNAQKLSLAAKTKLFKLVWHVLSKCRPMTDVEKDAEFILHLEMEGFSKSHTTDSSAWVIAESIEKSEVLQLAAMVKEAEFIGVSIDESDSVSHREYLSIEIYFIGHAQLTIERRHAFLSVAHVTDLSASGLTATVIAALKSELSLSDADLQRKLVIFAADGASVMQGDVTGVGRQLQEYHAPFITSCHCPAHRLALASKALGHCVLFSRLERLVAKVYNKFSRSTKKTEALRVCALATGTAGHQLKNKIEIRWLSTEGAISAQRSELPALMKYFKQESDERDDTGLWVWKELMDLEVFFSHFIFEPLLTELVELSKLLQRRHLYFGHVNVAVKDAIQSITRMYITESTRFSVDCSEFAEWHHIVTNPDSPIQFISEVGESIEEDDAGFLQYVVYPEEGDVLRYSFTGVPTRTGAGRAPLPTFVDLPLYNDILVRVQEQGTIVAQLVLEELNIRFPASELLTALSICQVEFWNDPTVCNTLSSQIDVLDKFYGQSKTLRQRPSPPPTALSADDIPPATLAAGQPLRIPSPPPAMVVEPILDIPKLRYQSSAFSSMMQQYALEAKSTSGRGDDDCTRTTRAIWSRILDNPHSSSRISEFCRLVKLVATFPIGSVENERRFSLMNLIHDELRNSLKPKHLNTCMRIAASKHRTFATFDVEAAHHIWFTAGPIRRKAF